MALEDLTPAVRVESILNGDEITPANRLEYFLQKAATELPKPAAGDAGKVLSVSSGGTGLEWASKAYILELLQNNTIVYVNETMAEILSIISSGTPLILHIPSSSEYIPNVGYFTIPFVGEVPDEEIYIVNCGEFVLAATTLNDSPSYNFD